jgi:hypothetical protein
MSYTMYRGQDKDYGPLRRPMDLNERSCSQFETVRCLSDTVQEILPFFCSSNECSLRLSGNIDIDPATQDMTLQNVYGFYQQRPDRAVVNVDSKLKLPKGTSMVFEFYINEKIVIHPRILWI